MNRIVHFEFHAPDVTKALKFYTDVFGWKTQQFPGPMEYHLLFTGDGKGIDGAVMQSIDGQPRTVNTVQVENVDQAVEKAIAYGGTLALPKFAVPGVGYVAFLKDPGGLILGVMHEDKNAK